MLLSHWADLQMFHGMFANRRFITKSGYDHVMVTDGSQAYVGFSLGRLWLVCTTLPFGWEISPYIYHSIGLAATGFLRSQGIPCSLHIDYRLNGEIITATGPWSKLSQERPKALRLEAAKATLYVVLSLVLELGDTTGMGGRRLLFEGSSFYRTITPCHWKRCFQASAHLFRWLCQQKNVFSEKSVRLDLIVQGKISPTEGSLLEVSRQLG